MAANNPFEKIAGMTPLQQYIFWQLAYAERGELLDSLITTLPSSGVERIQSATVETIKNLVKNVVVGTIDEILQKNVGDATKAVSSVKNLDELNSANAKLNEATQLLTEIKAFTLSLSESREGGLSAIDAVAIAAAEKIFRGLAGESFTSGNLKLQLTFEIEKEIHAAYGELATKVEQLIDSSTDAQPMQTEMTEIATAAGAEAGPSGASEAADPTAALEKAP